MTYLSFTNAELVFLVTGLFFALFALAFWLIENHRLMPLLLLSAAGAAWSFSVWCGLEWQNTGFEFVFWRVGKIVFFLVALMLTALFVKSFVTRRLW